MKKIKEFFSWPVEIIRTVFTKLVDKIFGKRCLCPEDMLRKHQPMRCKVCGKIYN
jgi:hypothetical protein